jgi:hypothetical protein
MLMIPPALQTKSGAQRMPWAASASASSSAASWLLAAPAIARQRQLRHGVVVEHTAERARSDDVDVGGQRARRVGPLRAEALGQLALARVDVGDHELGAGVVQQLGERPADVAGADHRDAAPVQVPRCRTRAPRSRGSRPRTRARSTGSGRRSRWRGR